MKPHSHKRAREIQASIQEILLSDWDPIGIRGVPEAQDEYDGYVGGVYRLLAEGATEAALVAHLSHVQSDQMGLPTRDRTRLSIVVQKLRELDITI